MADTAEQQVLGLFEDVDVTNYRIRLMNTGDGLSPSMASDRELHLFDDVYVLVHARVKRVQFDGDEGDGVADRIAVLRAETATIVEETFASKRIDAQRRRDEELKAEQAEKRRQERKDRKGAGLLKSVPDE